MSYVARWEQLKKDFEKASGLNRPKQTKDTIVGTIQKASGITPVLKEVDAAIAKKQRTPLAQALNKFFAVRGPYVTFLQNEMKQYLDDLEMATAFKDLMVGLGKIDVDAAAELKKFQEAKSPGKVAIEFLQIEGDVKGTVAAAKKDLAPFAAIEKKHKILAKADAAVKDAEKYTKAAAKTEYKNAREALVSFKANSKKCAEDVAKIISAENDANFKKAAQKFHDAMKAFSVVQRVDGQIKKLQEAEAAAVAGA